jgi:hypothetical protein
MVRRWVGGLMALAVICASGCAASTGATPGVSPVTTPPSAVALHSDSYAGIHWTGTQVWLKGTSHPVPATMDVGADFLPSGSVIFTDGVNAVTARWVSPSSDVLQLDWVGTTAAGYVGKDPVQLAAILAVRQITSTHGAAHESSNQPAANITVTRGRGTLALTGNGVKITYRNAGPTAPEHTRAPLATAQDVGSASTTARHTPGSATTHRSALSAPIAMTSGADIAKLCSKPSSQFGRFWIISAGSSQEQDHGTVDVDGTTVPAAAIYTSSGQPGVGVLCISNLSISPSSPVRSVTEASGRPIAYLAADEQGLPYLAVKPGVTKVKVSTSGGHRYTYEPTSTGELQLQDIGAGWHAVSVGYGMPSATVMVTAYNTGGDVLDTRVLDIP